MRTPWWLGPAVLVLVRACARAPAHWPGLQHLNATPRPCPPQRTRLLAPLPLPPLQFLGSVPASQPDGGHCARGAAPAQRGTGGGARHRLYSRRVRGWARGEGWGGRGMLRHDDDSEGEDCDEEESYVDDDYDEDSSSHVVPEEVVLSGRVRGGGLSGALVMRWCAGNACHANSRTQA